MIKKLIVNRKNKLKLYKALHREPDGTLSCKPARYKYQKYEIGKSYKVDGDIKLCQNGFHACRKIKDIFNYYDAIWTTAIAEIEAWGEIEEDESEKLACQRIKIKKILLEEEIYEILRTEDYNKEKSIYNSDLIYKSYCVSNSSHIDGSYAIYNSNSVKECHAVYNSRQIRVSEATHGCDCGVNVNGAYNCDYLSNVYGCANSNDLETAHACYNAYGIKYSEAVYRSFGVAYSNAISNSLYIHQCEGLDCCIFCYNLKGKRLHIFNKEVSEEEYLKTKRDLLLIGNDFYPMITRFREEAIAYGKWSVDILKCRKSSIRYNLMKANKNFLEYIKNIPHFNEDIFEKITALEKVKND